MQQTLQIGKSAYTTPNTKLAAALLTLGVDFADKSIPVTNIYDEKRPYRAGCPGNVSYLLEKQTATGVESAALAQAFREMTADKDLDALVDEIAAAAPALGIRLRKLLPLALACYLRGGLENRERILDLWRKAKPMVLVRKSETSFVLVSRDASEKTLRHCGL